ncbi:MAG: rubrerythrin family protein, partial [Mucinivorans sp.]
MKKVLLMALAAVAMFSCAKPEKTIENLKAAATGESNASAHYALYAERAAADSLFNIAAMFQATSASEKIHASNHLAELAKLGVTDFTPVIEEVVVDSTYANLVAANAGEEYEFGTMYPGFIEVAIAEKATGAQQVCEWAMAIEKKHSEFYKAAMAALVADSSDKNLPTAWVVCTKCGDTFVKND